MADTQWPVIVGVDGSPDSLGAVRWAADAAARQARALKVAHALGAPGASHPAYHDAQGLVLEAAAEARRWQPGVEVSTTTCSGTPGSVLTDLSRRAGLVVVGSRGHGGFSGLLIGSVSGFLASHAHCPVLVVHNGQRWASSAESLPHREPVVVGVDTSPAAQHALGLAFQEATSRGVPLVAVRTWQEPGHQRWRRASVDPAVHDAAAGTALRADLEPWRAKFASVPVRAQVVHGGAAAVLTDASRTALMVVLGARGRGVSESIRLGSVTQQVLHHAASPVMVARSQ